MGIFNSRHVDEHLISINKISCLRLLLRDLDDQFSDIVIINTCKVFLFFDIVYQDLPATQYKPDIILNILGELPTIAVPKHVGLDTKLI